MQQTLGVEQQRTGPSSTLTPFAACSSEIRSVNSWTSLRSKDCTVVNWDGYWVTKSV